MDGVKLVNTGVQAIREVMAMQVFTSTIGPVLCCFRIGILAPPGFIIKQPKLPKNGLM